MKTSFIVVAEDGNSVTLVCVADSADINSAYAFIGYTTPIDHALADILRYCNDIGSEIIWS